MLPFLWRAFQFKADTTPKGSHRAGEGSVTLSEATLRLPTHAPHTFSSVCGYTHRDTEWDGLIPLERPRESARHIMGPQHKVIHL